MSSAVLPPLNHAEITGVGTETSHAAEEKPRGEGVAMVVFSGELDKLLAAFTIANGAAAMDMPVSMFFTFWGINLLRREGPVHLTKKKTTTEGMFGAMMPRGPGHMHLSRLNMVGLGTRMMKQEMGKKHVENLGRMVRIAQEQGVRFIACTMSMDLMGLHKEELIDGITFGNVASFLDAANKGSITLFI